MFHLLTETSVFIPLPNECLFQITGEPIVHMKPPPLIRGLHGLQNLPLTGHPRLDHLKRKAPGTLHSDRPLKRMKSESIIRTDSMESNNVAPKPKHEPVKYVCILCQA